MLNPAKTINAAGHLIDLSDPVVMGIINITPDSFYDGGEADSVKNALQKAEDHLSEGARFLDIGGVSTRPGADWIEESEELDRVLPVLKEISREFPSAIISIDTFRSEVARRSLDLGAHMINDISAGIFSKDLFDTIASYNVPYVLMHMSGTPATMQQTPIYQDVNREVLRFFIDKLRILHHKGVKDIIIDPGFGFGKNLEHNYSLLKHLEVFQILEKPILVGVSRKSMICRLLNVKPANALNGSTALHMVALQKGARILRVHDVKEAVETIDIWKKLEEVDFSKADKS